MKGAIKHAMLLLLSSIGGGGAQCAAGMPQNYWEWDSLRLQTELRALEYRINEDEVPSLESFEMWSTLLLEFGMFDHWMETDSIRERWHQHEGIHSLESQVLYTSWMSDVDAAVFDDLISKWGRDRLNWELARHIHAFRQAQKRSDVDMEMAQTRLNEIRVIEQRLFDPVLLLWWVAGLLLVLMIGRFVSNRGAFVKRLATDGDPPLIQRIRMLFSAQDGGVHLRLSLTELELLLLKDAISERFGDSSQWVGLSERQQLLLFLMLQGHSLDDCAEYLGLSKGHLYNQRTELRRIFGLSEGAELDEVWRR